MDTSEIILSTLSGFAVGVASSAAVAVPIYLQQRRDAGESEQRLVLLIEAQLRHSAKAFSTVRELTIQNEELQRSFTALRHELLEAPRNRAGDIPRLVEEYGDVARSLAAARAGEMVLSKTLPSILTVDTLTSLHRDLFPSGYELAGRIRSVQVWVGPSNSSRDTAQFVPPAPYDVMDRLSSLVEGWSAGLGSLRGASRAEQAFEVARFHHGLVSIHPFLDGNGVTARLVSSLQIKQLSGHASDLIRNDAQYYAALQLADTGELDALWRMLQAKFPAE